MKDHKYDGDCVIRLSSHTKGKPVRFPVTVAVEVEGDPKMYFVVMSYHDADKFREIYAEYMAGESLMSMDVIMPAKVFSTMLLKYG